MSRQTLIFGTFVLIALIGTATAYTSVPTISNGIGFEYQNVLIGNDRITVDTTVLTKDSTIVIAASDSLYKFGADYICSGTDDHIQINGAINQLTTHGGKVTLLDGSYSVDTILLRSFVTLEGQGFGTKLTKKSGTTGAVISTHPDTEGVLIKDVLVDGNEGNVVSYSRGIVLRETSHGSVINCWAQNTQEGGTYAIRGVGIYVTESTDCVVLNCFATDNSHEGIGVRENSERVSVIGCVSWNNDAEGIQVSDESTTGACHDILIANNLIYDHQTYAGITVHSDGAENITITGNVIKNCTAGVYSLTDSVLILNKNIVVSNNIITDIGTHAAGITLTNTMNSIITGNLISDVEGAGIYLQNADNTTMSSNSVSNTAGYGVDVVASLDTLLMNNNIRECLAGMIFDDTSHYSMANNNKIVRNTQHGMLCMGKYTIISNNYIIDNNRENSNWRFGLSVTGSHNDICDNKIFLSDNTHGHYYGISLVAGADHCVVMNNDLRDSGRHSAIHDLATGTITRNNVGHTTETSGSTSIASTVTSVLVTHGLDATPTAGDIMVTPTSSLGTANSFWVGHYSASTFSISVNTAPGVNVGFAWKAIIL